MTVAQSCELSDHVVCEELEEQTIPDAPANLNYTPPTSGDDFSFSIHTDTTLVLHTIEQTTNGTVNLSNQNKQAKLNECCDLPSAQTPCEAGCPKRKETEATSERRHDGPEMDRR